MAVKKQADPSVLSDAAWEMIQEALQEGSMTLGNGKKVQLSPLDVVRITQWLATLKAKKPKLLSGLEDFK